MVGISDIGTLSYIPSLNPRDLLVGVSVAALVKLIVYIKGKNKKKYRQGKEYGSARWGESKDIAPYIDPKFEKVCTKVSRFKFIFMIIYNYKINS